MHASLPLRRHARPIWPPPDPRLTPGRRRTPQPAAADAGPALAAGTGRCQRTPAPRGPVRRRTVSGTSTDAQSRAHASDATSTSTRQRSRITTSLTHLTTTSATLAIAHPRSPPTPASSPAPSPSRPWLPFLVLYFLILMLVLVPITLAAAPPPAYHLPAWAGLPGVCLAGRGRGVQREAVDPPSSKAQA